MKKSLEVYPELCEPMPVGGQEYVFLCERSVYYMKEDVHPFPEVPLIGDRDWVFVDPLTMGPTGTSRRLIVHFGFTSYRYYISRQEKLWARKQSGRGGILLSGFYRDMVEGFRAGIPCKSEQKKMVTACSVRLPKLPAQWLKGVMRMGTHPCCTQLQSHCNIPDACINVRSS